MSDALSSPESAVQPNTLEGITSYRFLLLLAVLIQVADWVLFLTSGGSFLTASWGDVRASPWVLAMIVLAFGASLTWGAAALSILVKGIESLIFDLRLRIGEGRPFKGIEGGYVMRSQAEKALEADPNSYALASFRAQVARREQDNADWHRAVSASSVCLALAIGSASTEGTLMHELTGALSTQNAALLWVAVCMVSWPLFYQLWSGEPGDDRIYWPKLSDKIQAKWQER